MSKNCQGNSLPGQCPVVVSASSLREFPHNIWPFCTAVAYYNSSESIVTQVTVSVKVIQNKT